MEFLTAVMVLLWPLVFLCYVCKSVDCMLLQCADDRALIVSENDPAEIHQNLTRNLDNCNTLVAKTSTLQLAYIELHFTKK